VKKNILYIVLALLLVGGVVTLHQVRRNSVLRGLEVRIETGGPFRLITSEEVETLLLDDMPGLMSQTVKEVDRDAVAATVGQNPYVKEVDVDVSNGGRMELLVFQHQPVVRMFYQDNEFYLSYEGTVMPLAPQHYCNVLVGSSDFREPVAKQLSALDLQDTLASQHPQSLMAIWTLSRYLYDHPAYGEVFDQVYLSPEGDLCLVPKLGSLQVVVGDTSRLDQKFENLWAFFDQGISQVGWDAYKVISLKYNDQVVCTKNETK